MQKEDAQEVCDGDSDPREPARAGVRRRPIQKLLLSLRRTTQHGKLDALNGALVCFKRGPFCLVSHF